MYTEVMDHSVSGKEAMTKKDFIILIPFFAFYFLLTYLVRHNFFFWDTVQLGSQQAHWFYDRNFSKLLLPEEIDSGHPPLFGFYLALVWKIFGKSLAVSHFSVLPFLIGIVVQLYALLKIFIPEKVLPFVLIVLLADPTLLAQSTLVSPDIVLVFFFLLALNAVIRRRKVVLSIALIFLAIISMRGMMHVMILFVIDAVLNIVLSRERAAKVCLMLILSYVPSAMVAGSWLLLHYKATGWIGYHAGSPWAECFKMVDASGAVRNVGIMGWRMLDFGRVCIWLIALPVAYVTFKRKVFGQNMIKLSVFFFVPLLLLSPNLIIHANLLAHRYLIVLYLSFALLILYQAQRLWPKRFIAIFFFIITGLLTGNAWRYPERIAQGWDSSLAHYPYYRLRTEMLLYIHQQGIDKKTIGTDFPNNCDTKFIDLSDESWSFSNVDFEKNSYLFYSNVFNGFSDAELTRLEKWKPVKILESFTVKVILYKKSGAAAEIIP